MRFSRFILPVLILFLLLPCCALGESADMSVLAPIAMIPEADGQVLDLYCGPTQGFYRHAGQTLDTGSPYILFGQYDCWAMVAQGTADSFGPIGWVEAGSITDIPYEPQLGFEDGFTATVEENAPMTDNPLAETPFDGWTATLAPGDPVTVLAQMGDWLYVQAELEDAPVRAFVRANTIF